MMQLQGIIRKIQPLDNAAMQSARARQDMLTKPRGSLGRLEELSIQLAGMTANPLPSVERKAVIVMAADHGVALEGVSVNARIAWVFRYLEEESVDDVARLCGCSRSTAKRRIADAHQVVRRALSDD